MGALVEQFRSDDHRRHSEWLRQQRWFIKSKHDNQRREEIADGEISEAKLEELDAELLDLMPSSVRGHVVGLEAETPQADSKTGLSGQKVASTSLTSIGEIAKSAPTPL